MFEPLIFENLNETDIREEILAPLIKMLGYRSGTRNNVIREQSLRYPKAFIGRKNSCKDPILRGAADYILEAGSQVRWVIEAKAPNADIGLDSIDQAYTYANHPEIRAVYFCLSNGRRFVVFQTNRGPESEPLIDIPYDELEENYLVIQNLLSPSSIIRDHPDIKKDTGTPIGEGLRSVARITNGLISYDNSSLQLRAIQEMQVSISGGAIERTEDGRLVAFINTIAPTRSLQELNERLGLTSFEMFSVDKFISGEPSKPTTFLGERTTVLPAGEQILDINSWRPVTIPKNITCGVTSKAVGHLEANRFQGNFISIINFQELRTRIDLHGHYEIYIA